MRRPILFLLAVLFLSGCAQRQAASRRGSSSAPGPLTVAPTLAVLEFENRSGFSGQWNLGSGMADMLTTRLVDSGQVTVVDRRSIEEVQRELRRQENRFFRREGAAQQGRLRLARYLVRGTVTDFTVTGDTSGWFARSDASARVRASRARVAVNLMVSDVETGEIISSVQSAGHASGRGLAGGVQYRSLNFGGDAYFRTPLGRATEMAIDRAVRRVLRDLPPIYWEPLVAEVEGARVVVNGGRNVNLQPGQRFTVHEEPRHITDPLTGDVIDITPGRVTGRIELLAIKDLSSDARLLEGSAQRGAQLRLEASRR